MSPDPLTNFFSWAADYLDQCRVACAEQMPQEIYTRTWDAVWSHMPRGDCLYVRRSITQDRSKGGLYIPEIAQSRNHYGWVLTAGTQPPPGFPIGDPLDLVGRIVFWGDYAGTPMADHALERSWDGDYLMINYMDILGIRIRETA